jgi:hypothetical protein
MRLIRRGFLIGFVILHLAHVVGGVLKLAPWSNESSIGKGLEAYNNWTGSGSSYGFFAPAVPNQILASITFTDASGNITEVQHIGSTRDGFDLRFSSMMFVLGKAGTHDLHARVLAAYALGRRPDAKQVTVVLSYYEVPSMEEYRHGIPPKVVDFYAVTFARRSDLEN